MMNEYVTPKSALRQSTGSAKSLQRLFARVKIANTQLVIVRPPHMSHVSRFQQLKHFQNPYNRRSNEMCLQQLMVFVLYLISFQADSTVHH